MLALGIEYLTGFVCAARDGADKQQPEWPPHPDRVFMALAAAWFETGQAEDEGEALRWLEGLAPPSLTASAAGARTALTAYVPVNDIKDSLSVLPEQRSRQARGFPTVFPRETKVFFMWPDARPGKHAAALDALCRKVNRIGHSSTLARMWVEADPPRPNWIPDNLRPEQRLRITGPGRLHYLEQRFNKTDRLRYLEYLAAIAQLKGARKKRLREELGQQYPQGMPGHGHPGPGLWQGYVSTGAQEPGLDAAPHDTVFDHRLIILTLHGARPDVQAAQKAAAACRGLLMRTLPDPPPEWISGHEADGRPSTRPHLAILPLPFCGFPHADGRIMGMALAIPRHVESSDLHSLLAPFLLDAENQPRRHHLFLGRWLDCELALEERADPPLTLRSTTWTGPAREWATVTPLVLDRHHDGRDRWKKARTTVRRACTHIGLPEPDLVRLHSSTTVAGIPVSGDFPPLARKHGGRLRHIHAVLRFAEPVRGPVILGAGRYRGYGLCRPLDPQGV